jgi:hypothetical protein
MRLFNVVAAAVCGLAVLAMGQPAAGRDVLWNQSDLALTDPPRGLLNSDFGDFPDYSAFIVSDVSVPAGGWQVDRLTIWVYAPGGVPTTSSARLHVFRGGSPAGYDPQSAQTVEIFARAAAEGPAGVYRVHAEGLGLDLDAGTWFLGLTPEWDFAQWGLTFHIATRFPIGVKSRWRNPGNGWEFGTGWMDPGFFDGNLRDFAVRVEGVPSPTGAGVLVLAAGVLMRRRARGWNA